VAAIPGLVHSAISAYWMVGGTWLLETVGTSLVAVFAGRLWLLAPVVVVKAVVALGPLWLDRRGWPWPRITRAVTWLAAVVLVVWGGANCVLANLVLAGVLGDGPQDRAAMIGHAWLWDPLFLIWGLLLLLGLRRSRPGQPQSPAGSTLP